MLHKHSKPHTHSDITAQDLTVQKLFVATCAVGSSMVLFHVAHEIPSVRFASILALFCGLAYAARQGWKLRAPRA